MHGTHVKFITKGKAEKADIVADAVCEREGKETCTCSAREGEPIGDTKRVCGCGTAADLAGVELVQGCREEARGPGVWGEEEPRAGGGGVLGVLDGVWDGIEGAEDLLRDEGRQEEGQSDDGYHEIK